MTAITLLTDFGTRDPYVGIMKGVILRFHSDMPIVDITHEVEPRDVREAAYLIPEYYRSFEKGSIHIAVVDPTVGSARRPMVVVADGHLFVGPDNGIFSLILSHPFEAYALQNPTFMLAEVSSTFHGRDIFAPAAAYLAQEALPSTFGEPIDKPVILPNLWPEVSGDILTGRVIRFDRFGNAITNISRARFEEFAGGRGFEIALQEVRFRGLNEAYFEREMTCLIGSNGFLEFAVFQGNFRERFAVTKGAPVTVTISRA
jgi:S-adenosyl-L-methionine hydrolase (adenosine-forming)